MSSRHKPSNYTVIPVLRIAPGLVYRYIYLDGWSPSREASKTTWRKTPAAAGAYSGILSPGSRKRLIQIINLLVAVSLPKKATHFMTGRQFTFRINFITLTLPAPQGDTTDQDLKRRALKQWLEYWKDRLPGWSYVWRAERQENGNLHFHITGDRYILYTDLRDTWNNALRKLGFIEQFKNKHGHDMPNSTDVHAVAHIRNLGAYIAKYMSKSEKHQTPVKGRVWDCSSNLKTKSRCDFLFDSALEIEWQDLKRRFNQQVFTTDFCEGIRLTESQAERFLSPRIREQWQNYLQSVRVHA